VNGSTKIPFESVSAAKKSKFDVGLQLLIKGDYQEAIAIFDEVIKSIPYHAHAWFLRGEALVFMRVYEECITCFDSALKFNPNYACPGYRRGLDFEKEIDNLYGIVNSFSETIKVKSNDARLWYNKGVLMCVLGEIEEALGCIEQVIKICPDYFEAWCHRGGLLGISGWHKKNAPLFVPQQLKDAINAYDRALKIRLDPTALVNRGLVMINAGQFKNAIGSFDEAIRIKPDYGDAWLQKGMILVRMKKRKEADECFERAIKIQPEYINEYHSIIDEWRPGPLEWD
jgi:tetratricopeptide (TPR) repeat protein